MSDYSNLPQELLVEIFLRLPIKDLVKSTAVCKSWNSVIKNPNFISTHLGKAISSPDSHLLLFRLCTWEKPYYSVSVEHYSLRFDNEDVNEYKQLHFPSNFPRSVSTCFRVVGICNGLVCLVDDVVIHVDDVSSCDRDYNYILWNPFIKKAIRLPEPSLRFRIYYGMAFTGFGFDSKTKDYKLLRFFEMDDKSIEVELYSLNANRWTSITSIAPNYSPLYRAQYYYGNSFVNGAIHLLACDRNERDRSRNIVLLAFDVSEEVFSEIPLPDHFSNASILRVQLLKYRQSSIATMTWECERKRRSQIHWERRSQIHLWVMKEYGVATSWTKVLTSTEAGESVARVLFFRQDEQVFVRMQGGWIASLDIKTKHSKGFGVHSVPSLEEYLVVDSYVESLVLLDKCCNISPWDVIN
ncbi:hypothetical protein COLO4_14881 [Corchorus olitorius]|uniref:F-box domain-containing protein n=1 Tax=Corchorus olitorius TaxID=93759 RepID=A0A1R3JQH4_9ROSI|nr:hypothetical protein COLO4_14881 [Corchorus olitorius]